MLERWKKQLFSEDGMKVVNVLFILLYLVRNPLFTICAYTVWFVYLVYSVRHTKKRGMKIFYSVLAALAMVNRFAQYLFYHLYDQELRERKQENW